MTKPVQSPKSSPITPSLEDKEDEDNTEEVESGARSPEDEDIEVEEDVFHDVEQEERDLLEPVDLYIHLRDGRR